jgi:hypothetical protein
MGPMLKNTSDCYIPNLDKDRIILGERSIGTLHKKDLKQLVSIVLINKLSEPPEHIPTAQYKHL